ncbi:MAG: CIA30 family protein [Elusimicrobia bacterium]|nr:CIA30 family protein [Elusimicrobiota bacterium]
MTDSLKKLISILILINTGITVQLLHAEGKFSDVDIPIEKTEDWKLDGSAASTSQFSGLVKNFEGEKISAKLLYDFNTQENDYVNITNIIVLPSVPLRIKLKLYGDARGCSFRINIMDESGEIFQAVVVSSIGWNGWREVNEELKFDSHWGGNNNGLIEGKVSFLSFVIDDEPSSFIGGGRIFIAKTSFLCAVPKKIKDVSAVIGRSETVVVDDFERSNQNNRYKVFRGDSSELSLTSSYEAKSGNLSMEMEYTLSTDRFVPSWVSAADQFKPVLNWQNVEGIKFWVKGDGSPNILQVNILTASGNVWQYENRDVLKKRGWTELSVPISDFRILSEKENEDDRSSDMSKIKSLEFAIVGTSYQTYKGKICIDQFSVRGKELDPLITAPAPSVQVTKAEPVNIRLADNLSVKYMDTPERNKEILYYNKLYVLGSMENVGIQADIVSKEKEVGDETAVFSYYGHQESNPAVELLALKAILNNIHPNLETVTIGNLWIDYPVDYWLYLFYPSWRYKGVQVRGEVTGFNYDAFVIKHKYDSTTTGGQIQRRWKRWTFRHTLVRFNDTAKRLANAEINKYGQLYIPSEDVEIATSFVGNDLTYAFDMSGSHFEKDNLLEYSILYSKNKYRRDAIKDMSNPYAPTISDTIISPVREEGEVISARLKLKNVLKVITNTEVQYRKVDTKFKPRFRVESDYLASASADSSITDYFDDFYGDQKGWNYRVIQVIRKFTLNAEYDEIKRLSNTDYYRKILQGNVGLYNINGTDIVFSTGRKRDKYGIASDERSTLYIDPSNPRNEINRHYELYISNKISQKTNLWTKYRTENIYLYLDNHVYPKHYYQIKGEHFFNNNAKITLEHMVTRYAKREWDPSGDDTDNFTTLTLDIYF